MRKDIFLKKLGEHIRALRKKNNLTQVELANLMGKDRQSLQRIELGIINPSAYYLLEIAKALDISLKTLLDFDIEDKKK